MNQPDINALVVRAWLDRAWQKRNMTLVFAVDVAHIHALVAEFRERNVDARGIHVGMPTKERDAVLDAFKKGEFPVLVNCAILTEGADIPAIDCVLLMRPTKSSNLFSQMIGRGMRQFPGKTDCLIMDVVGNVENELACTPTLCGLETQFMTNEGQFFEFVRKTKEVNASALPGYESFIKPPENIAYIDYKDPHELQRAMSARVCSSMEKLSPNAWVDCGSQTYVLSAPDGSYVKIRRVENEWHAHFYSRNATFFKDYAAGLPASTPYFKRKILTSTDLGHAVRGCDTFMNQVCNAQNRAPMWLLRTARWRFARATPRSRAMVEQILAGRDNHSAKLSSNLTQGEVHRMLLRLRHGGKSQWQKAMKQRNRKVERRDAFKVKVGPLQ